MSHWGIFVCTGGDTFHVSYFDNFLIILFFCLDSVVHGEEASSLRSKLVLSGFADVSQPEEIHLLNLSGIFYTVYNENGPMAHVTIYSR